MLFNKQYYSRLLLLAIVPIQSIMLIVFIFLISYSIASAQTDIIIISASIFALTTIFYVIVSIRLRNKLIDKSELTIYDVGPILLISFSLIAILISFGFAYYIVIAY